MFGVEECGAVRLAGSPPCVRRPGHERPAVGERQDPDDELHDPGDGSGLWREMPLTVPRRPVESEVVAASRAIRLPFTATAMSGHLVTVEPASPVRVDGAAVRTVRIADRLFAASVALELSVAIVAAVRGICQPGMAGRRHSRTVRPLAGGGPVQVRPCGSGLLIGVWRFEFADALELAAAIAAAVHRPLAKVAATRPTRITSGLDRGYAERLTSVMSGRVVEPKGGRP